MPSLSAPRPFHRVAGIEGFAHAGPTPARERTCLESAGGRGRPRPGPGGGSAPAEPAGDGRLPVHKGSSLGLGGREENHRSPSFRWAFAAPPRRPAQPRAGSSPTGTTAMKHCPRGCLELGDTSGTPSPVRPTPLSATARSAGWLPDSPGFLRGSPFARLGLGK